MKKMGRKCLILQTWSVERGFFWSNDGGFSLWGGKKYCIQSFESASLFSQKLKKKKYSTLNGVVLTNSYR
jgi:hypothetical protein